jgi:hypothetical protein
MCGAVMTTAGTMTAGEDRAGMFVTMGHGSAGIGGVARPAGTTGDGAGQSCAVRTMLTAVICAGGEISDRAAEVAIGLSLQGAAWEQARAGAVGSSLLEVQALPVDSLLQAAEAVAGRVAAGRVAVVGRAAAGTGRTAAVEAAGLAH